MKKVVRKLFFAWQEEKEKQFLESMSLQGYILTEAKFGKYTFMKQDLKKLIYEFDYNVFNSQEDEEEYIEIFKSTGWHLCCKYGGWYYFCHEDDDSNLNINIFSNNKSQREKYKRLGLYLFISGLPVYSYIVVLRSLVYKPLGLNLLFLDFIIYPAALVHLFVMVYVFNKYLSTKNDLKE